MWKLCDGEARWSDSRSELALKFTSTTLGVQLSRSPLDEEPRQLATIQPLRWAPNLPLVDHYIRGTDFVATFADSTRTMVAECYWRVVADNSLGFGLEWIVSVQTSLLDCHPQLETQTLLPVGSELLISADPSATDFTRLDQPTAHSQLTHAAARLVRPQGCRFSYLELIYPADQAGCERLSHSPTDCSWRVHWHVQSLEKGVIRRCRARVFWLPRQDDLQAATRCWRSLLDSPLPLTV